MRATDRQISYLRSLLDESFANLCGSSGTNLDRHHLDRVSKAEATKAIEKLLTEKKNGWGKTDVFSPTTRRLIGTVKPVRSGGWQAYSYPRKAGRHDFTSKEEALRWVRQE